MMRWNAQLYERLMTLVGQGLKWDAIAAQLGCAPTAAHAQWRKIRTRQIDDGAAKLRNVGKRSGAVCDVDVAKLKALKLQGLTKREISDRTGWSIRTLDRYLRTSPAGAPRYDITKYRDAYQASQAKPPNNRKHLQAVISHGGFRWWSEKSLERVYALERPLPQGRVFWRAA